MVDVAVIGGGPAGCAAALTLRKFGLSTTMITSGRPYKKPTETAVPQLRRLLDSLGAHESLAACEPCYGIESNWGASHPMLTPSILNCSGHPWFIHRDLFDASLLRLVDAAGADRLDANATSVNFTDDRYTVRTTIGPTEAKNIVIATGSPVWAARATGQKSITMDSMICYWAQLEVPFESRLLHVESTENGWWYLCRGQSATAFACFVTDAEYSRGLALSTPARWHALFHDTQLCRDHALDASAGQIHCHPISVTSVPCCYGSRWVIAGDAAIKLDPVGSCGSVMALESGVLAARALVDGQTGNQTATAIYDRWGKSLFAEFLKQRTRVYRAEADKYSAGFWARRIWSHSNARSKIEVSRKLLASLSDLGCSDSMTPGRSE